MVKHAGHVLASFVHMTQPSAVHLGHGKDGLVLTSRLRAQELSQELMRGADEQATCWR